MKITKKELQKIIQEELEKNIEEGWFSDKISAGVDKLKGAFKGKDWEKEAEKTAEEPAAAEPAAAEPAAGKPADAAPAKPDASELATVQKQVDTSTQDVPVPQLMVMQQVLKGTIRNALLASVPKEKLNVVMPAVMGYINRLPKMSRIIAEGAMPAADDAARIAALKNKLAAKHGKGGPMIANNLKRVIEAELSRLLAGGALRAKLLDAATKMPQNKETAAYVKSIERAYEPHKQAFAMHSKLVTDNIVALVLAAMPKAAVAAKPVPGEDKKPEAPKDSAPTGEEGESFFDVERVGIHESKRWQKLAGILKD